MSHLFKRGMAFALAGMMMFQSFFPVSASALEQNVSMNNVIRVEETVSSNDVVENMNLEEEQQELLLEQVVVSENTVEEKEKDFLLNYVYIQNPVVETPGTQMILVGAGDEDDSFDKAVLTYENYRTGECFTIEGHAFEGESNLLSFEETFQDADKSGIYVVKEVCKPLLDLMVRFYTCTLHWKAFRREVWLTGRNSEANTIFRGEILRSTSCITGSLFPDQCDITTLFQIYCKTLSS